MKDTQEALNAWANALACPACHQPLRLAQDQITCTACNQTYPILDGIPVLIAGRSLNQRCSTTAQSFVSRRAEW
jgi:uncharacterized protein YbaR (Trm112 family)